MYPTRNELIHQFGNLDTGKPGQAQISISMDVSPLLNLPTELRLRIYEFAYDCSFVGSRLTWPGDRFRLDIRATSSGIGTYEPGFRIPISPFSLLRVCRKLYQEVAPLLPDIRDIGIRLDSLTHQDAQSWLELLDDERVSRIRHLNITVWDHCYLRRPMYEEGHRYDCESRSGDACTQGCQDLSMDENDAKAKLGLCDRSLEVDLTVLERDFDPDHWHRLLGADHRVQSIGGGYVGEPPYEREYYKGYYLLRNLRGCVTLPKPVAHPPRQGYPCHSVVDLQKCLAGLVSYDGELHVTKKTILELTEIVRGDGFQGGSAERYLHRLGPL